MKIMTFLLVAPFICQARDLLSDLFFIYVCIYIYIYFFNHHIYIMVENNNFA